MEFFLLFKFVLFVNFLPRSCQSRLGIEKGDKKQVIVYHPKPHHNPAVVLYGNEGSGQDEADKEKLNALANNVDTVTNLVKAQSEIIQNLGHQVSSVIQGTGNDKKFEKAFGKITNNTQKIHNITEKQNQTIKQVDELAGVWSATTLDLNKRVKHIQQKATENEEDIEEMEKDIVQKIEKLQEEVKALRLALKYSAEKNAANKEEWPSGKYCILANGSCPSGFKRHKGHLKSLYLYSSHSQFVGESKFGSSSIGCFGSYCGQYGNFIGSITIVTCCK